MAKPVRARWSSVVVSEGRAGSGSARWKLEGSGPRCQCAPPLSPADAIALFPGPAYSGHETGPRRTEPIPVTGGTTLDARTLDPAEAEHRGRLQRGLGDDYELRELIGSGGFGAVYAAEDLKLERDVAVKALRHDVFPTPALLERFQREAKAVAKLHHPNILPVHTVGREDGIAFMVMPLVEGESLRQTMDREGPLPAEETVRIVRDVAAALEAAHKCGFVHRDVKPANIMLEGADRWVWLMDFGIAKAAAAEDTAMTGTGMIVGSIECMSPEQAAGRTDVDGRSDIYALGAVAYEMLTGKRPYPARTLHELVYRQVTESVPDLADVAPGVPPGVARAVMRSLATEREDRWQTAADFSQALTVGDAAHGGSGEAARYEEESWLSRRGPYILLLAFLLYFVRYFAGAIRGGFGPAYYEQWAGSSILAFGQVAVVVLLVAAGVDVLVRAALRLHRDRSWSRVAYFLFGQPDWWQAWYPRSLRVRDSVWDRLPFTMKLLRTLVWLELIILPAGLVLGIFVTPTLTTMAERLGQTPSLSVRLLGAANTLALWALPVTAALLALQFRAWHTGLGIPRRALMASLFNLRGSYWQGSRARAILRD